VVRKVRQRRVAGEEGGEGGGGGGKKKKKKRATICELNGWQWEGRKRVEVSYCLILWKGYPPELATWELESLFDAYEAELDAAAPELGARRRRRRTSGGRAEE